MGTSQPTPEQREAASDLLAVDSPPETIAAPERPDLGDVAWAAQLRSERRSAGAPQITGIVHTRNEERNLPDALRSLGWVDQLIVVDMESSDRTIEVAESFEARVLQVPNMGYVLPARNAGVRAVETEWIFTLDADERVQEPLARILDQITREDIADVVQVHWRLWIAGRFIEASGWQDNWHTRFFRKGFVEYGTRVHSLPELKGRVTRVPYSPQTSLIHFNYDDLTHFVTKLNRYTDREAEALAGEPAMPWPQLAAHLRQEFSWHWTPDKDGSLSAALSFAMLFYRFIAQAKHWQHLGFPDLGLPDSPQQALQDLANDGRILHAAGVKAAMEGRGPDSVELLTKAVAAQLSLGSLHDLAVMHAQAGRVDEARSLLRACTIIDPAFTQARDALTALDS